MKTYKVKIELAGTKKGYYYVLYDEEYELESIQELIFQLKEDGWNESYIMNVEVLK